MGLRAWKTLPGGGRPARCRNRGPVAAIAVGPRTSDNSTDPGVGKLRGRGTEAPDDLTLGHLAGMDAPLRLEGEPVKEQVPQVIGIAVVFQYLFYVDGARFPRLKFVAESFVAEFFVYVRPGDLILRSRGRSGFDRRQSP